MSFPRGKKTPRTDPGPNPGRWAEARTCLDRCLMAAEVISSIGAQLLFIGETRNLPGLKEIHRKNGAIAHQLLTSLGCLDRMAHGDWHETVLAALVHSLYATREQMRFQKGRLERTRRTAPKGGMPALENWMSWLHFAEDHLQRAMIIIQQLVGSGRWIQIMSGPPKRRDL